MNREQLTISSVRHYLSGNLSPHYQGRELNAIIRIILSHISGKDHAFILAHPEHEIPSFNWFKVNKICDDLKNMVPVQYITGVTEFYGIELKVTEHTLIPRQETEELVGLIIKENRNTSPVILDIGTGSGCIAISLAVNIDGAQISATDRADEIIAVATDNSNKNSVEINFMVDDILNPCINKYGKYDLVVCNPPYIRELEKLNMEKNVLDFEPHQALFVPDDDPLLFYRAALVLCSTVLKKDGYLYFEINETMGKEMTDLLINFGYHDIKIINDINGKARITKSRKA